MSFADIFIQHARPLKVLDKFGVLTEAAVSSEKS